MSPKLILNDGCAMPQLGLGLMRFGAETETAAVMGRAAAAGYRLFDGAAVYGNEAQMGQGLRACGHARGDVFVTTKRTRCDRPAVPWLAVPGDPGS